MRFAPTVSATVEGQGVDLQLQRGFEVGFALADVGELGFAAASGVNSERWRAAPPVVGATGLRITGSNCVRLKAGLVLVEIVFIVLFLEPCRFGFVSGKVLSRHEPEC